MSNLIVKLILEAKDRLSQPVKRMAGNIGDFAASANRAIRKIGDTARDVGKTISGVGQAMSMKITAPILALGGASLKTAATFEKLKASLKTMTGSQEAANREFDKLLDFAATTPFQLEEVMQSYVKLVALGLDPSAESMRSFGNTASAMGKSLEQMVEAVADAITGEFERLKEFGIKANVEGNRVKFTFQGVTTTVKNNAEDIQKYLKSIGETKFGSAMEEQMDTLGGAFSNLQDSISTSLSIIGDEIADAFDIKEFAKDLGDRIKELAEAFKMLPEPVQGFIIKGGLVVALIGPLLLGFGQLALGIGVTIIGMSKLAAGVAILSGFLMKTLIPALFSSTLAVARLGIAFMATPFGWITAGIAALAVAGYLIVKNWETIKEFWTALWDGITARIQNAWTTIKPLIDTIAAGVSLLTNNAVTRAASRAISYMASPTSTGAAAPLMSPAQKVDAGGEIRIVIDENRPARASAKMNNPKVATTVDQGVIMGGAL